ncbi:hypothetical protein H1C71_000645, partial [Ictidomys tridecemlineatus]
EGTLLRKVQWVLSGVREFPFPLTNLSSISWQKPCPFPLHHPFPPSDNQAIDNAVHQPARLPPANSRIPRRERCPFEFSGLISSCQSLNEPMVAWLLCPFELAGSHLLVSNKSLG